MSWKGKLIVSVTADVPSLTNGRDDQAGEESRLGELFTLPFKWDDEIFEDLARDFGEMPAGLPSDTHVDYHHRAEMASRGPLLDPVETEKLPR